MNAVDMTIFMDDWEDRWSQISGGKNAKSGRGLWGRI